ncbi:hypothetical protein R3Q15_16885, partial [Gordonia amicalis]|nr:hypothetical protein [Gordonia amicalis]
LQTVTSAPERRSPETPRSTGLDNFSFPFEMDTMIGLANGKLVATHYGLYNTIVGAGILLGNAVTGWLYSVAATQGRAELIWVVLLLTGTASASALFVLNRRGWLALDVGLGREVATSQ